MEGELIQHAKSCVQSSLTYYFQELAGSMKEPLAAFKAAQLFSPFKVTELNPSNATIDTLSNLPFLLSAIPDLKVELPFYIAASEDIEENYAPLLFWKRHEHDLPQWSKAAQKMLLVQPSSAASEHVFSLLSNSFRERQHSSLQDYIEASLMLQYNNR